MVQSPTAALRHRLSVTHQLRKEPSTPPSPKSITVHETGATPDRNGPGGVVVQLVAVVADCQGGELEERQEMGPEVTLPVAWVFELGS